MTPMTFHDPKLAQLDGFRVEIDLERERADVILDRPPFNIISATLPHFEILVFPNVSTDSYSNRGNP